MTFSEQLKAHREKHGQTQAQLAAFLGVSARAIWQWEQGALPHLLSQEGVIARLRSCKPPPP